VAWTLGGVRRSLVDALQVGEVVDLHVGPKAAAPVVAPGEEDVPVVVAEIRPGDVERAAGGGDRRPPLVVEVGGEVHRCAQIDAYRRREDATRRIGAGRVDVLERLA